MERQSMRLSISSSVVKMVSLMWIFEQEDDGMRYSGVMSGSDVLCVKESKRMLQHLYA